MKTCAPRMIYEGDINAIAPPQFDLAENQAITPSLRCKKQKKSSSSRTQSQEGGDQSQQDSGNHSQQNTGPGADEKAVEQNHRGIRA